MPDQGPNLSGGTPQSGTNGQPGTGSQNAGNLISQGPNDPIQQQRPGTGQQQQQGQNGQQDDSSYRRNTEEQITRLMRERDEATRLLEDERRKGLTPEELARLKASDEAGKASEAKVRSLTLRYEIASRAPKLGIVDPELAVLLIERSEKVSVDDSGKVTGLDEALKDLIRERPHLVNRAVQQVDAGAGTGGNRAGKSASMNDIIRGAARRGSVQSG